MGIGEITDSFTYEISKAINGESFVIPSHLAVGTGVVTSISSTDTIIVGEIGTRESLTGTRTNNILELSAIRSGTDVIDTTNGDVLTNSGIFSASSDGTFLSGIVHSGITQTTNFDIDFSYTFTIVGRQ